MSNVKYTHMTTSLERKCRSAGGILVTDAVSRANVNVGALSESSLALIKTGIDEILQIIGDGSVRPDDAQMEVIMRRSNQMLGYCVPLKSRVLLEGLHAVCNLAEAVRNSDLWLPGTFHPLMATLRVTAVGGLSDAQGKALLGEIWRCVDKYKAAPATPSGV
ncbi:hypothetical protein BZG35_16665 [Brevundimonas sp. LM2]|uniref:hypothetical protein n=1 Tax=Brevundimonas sp. LM2 TaxID=1938605 RepID=UPI000983A96C|nr:hypothetical protein [Brevundimonas sp. LM2]AQR63102.1 hypothetical protein BZG35_16665 [Brevundimonas sp. LM2]